MNLMSCRHCGVVLDKDKLKFPEDTWNEELQSEDPELSEWNGEEFTSIVTCPVCKHTIREIEGYY